MPLLSRLIKSWASVKSIGLTVWWWWWWWLWLCRTLLSSWCFVYMSSIWKHFFLLGYICCIHWFLFELFTELTGLSKMLWFCDGIWLFSSRLLKYSALMSSMIPLGHLHGSCLSNSPKCSIYLPLSPLYYMIPQYSYKNYIFRVSDLITYFRIL